MKRRAVVVSLVAALGVGLVACGGSSDNAGDNGVSPTPTESTSSQVDDSTAPADGVDAVGSCRVVGSGDLDVTIDQPGDPVAATSDYWMSDEELAQAGAYLDDFDARMAAGRQIQYLLNVYCGDADQSVLLLTTDATTRADVPYAPGTYDIVPSLEAAARAGFQAGMTVDDPSNFLIDGGTVILTRFDSHGVAGTFAFDASEAPGFVDAGAEPRHVHYDGSFDLACADLAMSLCEG